jgi:hypothetical protein
MAGPQAVEMRRAVRRDPVALAGIAGIDHG